MSKRKHKNKFRFQRHPTPSVANPEQQSQLPLAPIAMPALDPAPADMIAEKISAPIPLESDLQHVSTESALERRLSAPTFVFDVSLGQRLRAAREARGLSCEAASHALRLPVTIVKALEAEQFERIGHGVFLRGYLGKYLQLLDLPQVLAERVVQDHVEPPPLTTNGTISHPRYLFERYSGSALYLILTGVIVVPAVLLALRAGFDQNLAHITPLDVTPPAAAIAPPSVHNDASPVATISRVEAQPAAVTKPEESLLVASMTPFPASASIPVAAPVNRMHLSLAHASWVEVVDSDGKKLEYGLVPAGSERDYVSDLALDVRIGNADGAALSIDGKAQDLAAFRRANVAHLKVSDGVAVAGHGAG